MTVLAAPLILAAHADKLPTLAPFQADGDRPAVDVREGPVLRADDPPEWLSLGYVSDADSAASGFEAVSDAQGNTRDAGTVGCELVVTAGDAPAARARTFELLAAWQQWLAGDRTLGGALVHFDGHLIVTVELDVTRGGGRAISLVTVSYRAITHG